MKRNGRYPSDQLLVEGCCAGAEVVWSIFFDRYGRTILRAIRRALGGRAHDKNLVDEIDAEVRDLLYEKHLLLVYERWQGSLSSFVAGFARKQVERFFQREKRTHGHEVLFTDAHLPELAAKIATSDPAEFSEILARLSPTQKHYVLEIIGGVRGIPKKRSALPPNERKLIERIRKKLKGYWQGR